MNTTELTVAFVDLAGFTALTEVHGDTHAADLGERFIELTGDSLGPEDRIAKTIGDGIMLTSPTPSTGVRLVRRIIDRCYLEPRFPVPHAGIHHGPIVQRGNDIYGATVNLAARIAAYADPGTLLATAAVADAARADGTPVTNVGPVALRNLAHPVDLYEIDLGGCPVPGGIDPACRMLVRASDAAPRRHHDRIDYWFCSPRCAQEFAANPQQYAAKRYCRSHKPCEPAANTAVGLTHPPPASTRHHH